MCLPVFHESFFFVAPRPVAQTPFRQLSCSLGPATTATEARFDRIFVGGPFSIARAVPRTKRSELNVIMAGAAKGRRPVQGPVPAAQRSISAAPFLPDRDRLLHYQQGVFFFLFGAPAFRSERGDWRIEFEFSRRADFNSSASLGWGPKGEFPKCPKLPFAKLKKARAFGAPTAPATRKTPHRP